MTSFNGSLVHAHCKPNADGIMLILSSANTMCGNSLIVLPPHSEWFTEWIVDSQPG